MSTRQDVRRPGLGQSVDRPVQPDGVRPPGDPNAPDGAARRSGPGPTSTLVLCLAALALVWAAGTARQLLAVRDDLEGAQAATEAGLAAARDADLEASEGAFQDAEADFARAAARMRNPLVSAATAVPIAGRNVATVRGLADAGRLVASAGGNMTRAVAGLPDLAPVPGSEADAEGALPVDVIARLGPPVAGARMGLERARQVLETTPQTMLIPPVAAARAAFDTELTQAQATVSAGEPLLQSLPAFLGAEGPRRYFFGAANPAELRGQSGFVGAFSILTIDDGRMSFSPFRPIQDLPDQPPGTVPAPYPAYEERYGRLDGTGVWRNLTAIPDFPSVGLTLERLWQETTGERLDGVITADPFALAALLEVAGPTDVPGRGSVDAGSVVDFVSNEAYGIITDSEERKRLLGDVAAATLDGFLRTGLAGGQQGGGAMPALGSFQVLAETAGQGHILLHAADPTTQEALEAAGIAGRLLNPPGDYFGTVITGTTSSKIDYYLERALDYHITLSEDGGGQVTTTLGLRNTAPTSGPASYVIGPNVETVEAGENEIYVTNFLDADAAVTEVLADGEAATPEVGQELGHPFVETFSELASGAERTLEYRVDAAQVWDEHEGGGRYRLTVQDQAAIRPMRLTAQITVPAGTEVTSVSEGLLVEGGVVRVDTDVQRAFQAEVRFAAPAPGPLRRLKDWLNRPVVQLGAMVIQ